LSGCDFATEGKQRTRVQNPRVVSQQEGMEGDEAQTQGTAMQAPATQPGGGLPRDNSCPGGHRQFSVCGSRFTLPLNYTVIKPIGQGAYGVVW